MLIRKYRTVLAALAVAATALFAGVPSASAEEPFAIVGDFTGNAGHIAFDENGFLSVESVASQGQIDSKSYGIGLSDSASVTEMRRKSLS